MKLMLMAGVMITLPAIVVAILGFGHPMLIPAIASLTINFIPFLIAGWLMKGNEDDAGH